jgi:hypothetical protein
MQVFRYITGLSILLYLMSSPLTGVWHSRIEDDGRIVHLRLLESFVFLLGASGTLTVILVLSFCIKYKNIHKGMRVGMGICNVAMIIFGLAVIFCAFQGLIHNFNWGNADFILFLVAAPSTVLFFIGIFVFIYGYNEDIGSYRNR